MNIAFITTNKHKFQEVEKILREFPVQLEHINMEYDENHDDGIEEIAKSAAKKLADELNRKVILEDTGLFFEAYNNFPGALPKFVFNSIGFKGIFKLLEGESRDAQFKTVAAFCEPGQQSVLFVGTMKGIIANTVHNQDADVMPYDKIFIPEGKTKPISTMTTDEKNKFSQRAEAFLKFGNFIKKQLDEAA